MWQESSDDEEEFAAGNDRAGCGDGDLAYGACPWSGDWGFHLHGFEDGDHLSCGDVVTDLDEHGHDPVERCPHRARVDGLVGHGTTLDALSVGCGTGGGELQICSSSDPVARTWTDVLCSVFS